VEDYIDGPAPEDDNCFEGEDHTVIDTDDDSFSLDGGSPPEETTPEETEECFEITKDTNILEADVDKNSFNLDAFGRNLFDLEQWGTSDSQPEAQVTQPEEEEECKDVVDAKIKELKEKIDNIT